MSVRVSDVKVGTKLKPDSGFTCMVTGANHTVLAAKKGKNKDRLFIYCACGQHFLDGQLSDDGETYVGFELSNLGG